MSGTVLEIIPPTDFDFGSTAAPGAGTNEVFVLLASRIDTSRYREGTLLVRVHDINIQDSNDTIVVHAAPDGFTPEDPAQGFIGEPAATVSLSDADNAPSYKVAALTDNFGPLLLIAVMGNRSSSSASTNALSAKLSVDLSLKS